MSEAKNPGHDVKPKPKPKEVPKVTILERLSAIIQEHYWLYGAPTPEAPNRVERWDLRSMLDYAVLTYEMGHFRPSYATFYMWRNAGDAIAS